MLLVDGRIVAEEIKADIISRVALLSVPPTLAIVSCDPNFETQKYLALKERTAIQLGITLKKIVLPETTDTDACVAMVTHVVKMVTGLIVQLPLPAHIDVTHVLRAIPVNKDVDAFGYAGDRTTVLPPVIGAIDEIATRYGVTFAGKRVVIFGAGRLVGAPAALYAKAAGAVVTMITPETTAATAQAAARTADIIILGVGKPGLLTPEMVKPGVVVFDAGASEDGGVLVGDADPRVATSAGLYTPVPGGIGPMTIAILFRNLLELLPRQ
jgi:methylenetetrahydrofolate dehydrogenase (NADP+) / methenyltetrahydrofolate cyclohydrolase